MVLWLLLGAAVIAGIHPGIVAVALLAYQVPLLFLLGVAVWTVFNRIKNSKSPDPHDEEVFLEGVAAELRAGSSLRQALVDGSRRSPSLDLAFANRLARLGRPMRDVAAAIRPRLAVNGPLVAPALLMASESGATIAPLFESLSARAAEVADEERERRAVTAQARLSAWIVGGAPLAIAGLVGVTNGSVFDGEAGRTVVVVGLGLEIAGAAVVWRMMRSSAS